MDFVWHCRSLQRFGKKSFKSHTLENIIHISKALFTSYGSYNLAVRRRNLYVLYDSRSQAVTNAKQPLIPRNGAWSPWLLHIANGKWLWWHFRRPWVTFKTVSHTASSFNCYLSMQRLLLPAAVAYACIVIHQLIVSLIRHWFCRNSQKCMVLEMFCSTSTGQSLAALLTSYLVTCIFK